MIFGVNIVKQYWGEETKMLNLLLVSTGQEVPGPSNSLSLIETGGSGWELALVAPQTNNNNNIHRPAPDTKFVMKSNTAFI